jgi:hypothetical protein
VYLPGDSGGCTASRTCVVAEASRVADFVSPA